jgi:hypothetical protein
MESESPKSIAGLMKLSLAIFIVVLMDMFIVLISTIFALLLLRIADTLGLNDALPIDVFRSIIPLAAFIIYSVLLIAFLLVIYKEYQCARSCIGPLSWPRKEG